MELGDFKDVRYNRESDEFTFVDEVGSVKQVLGCELNMLQDEQVDSGVLCSGESAPKISSALVKSPSRLVAFLYFLLRDKLPDSDVAEIVKQLAECQASGVTEFIFSNGWTAGYAEDIARYLLEDGTTIRDFSVQADELPTAHGGVVGV